MISDRKCTKEAERMKEEMKTIMGIVILAFAAIILGFSMTPNKADYRMVHETHIVQRGETLWSIARDYQEKSDVSEDIRAIMYEIEQMNPEMEHGQVYTGDKLKVYYWQRK